MRLWRCTHSHGMCADIKYTLPHNNHQNDNLNKPETPRLAGSKSIIHLSSIKTLPESCVTHVARILGNLCTKRSTTNARRSDLQSTLQLEPRATNRSCGRWHRLWKEVSPTFTTRRQTPKPKPNQIRTPQKIIERAC